MPIAVKHTIKMTENVKIARDPEIYRNPIADPPAFHVGCTCQWEGWATSRQQADFFVASHRHAQLMRGNTVEVILPEATAISTPAPDEVLAPEQATQPSLADAPIVASSETGTSAIVGLKAKDVDEPEVEA